MLRATASLPKQPFAFFIFHSAFLLSGHKNLKHDHCCSICNVLMMITGVTETLQCVVDIVFIGHDFQF